jgi:predicted Zn-dependent protease with MMP-like domain
MNSEEYSRLNWEFLLKIAREELESTQRGLPADIQALARGIPVDLESLPAKGGKGEEDADLLGLFEGDAYHVSPDEASPVPRRIVLFLENLWDFADNDPDEFRREVRVTYIHELGHFLGLDEEQLEKRGLL